VRIRSVRRHSWSERSPIGRTSSPAFAMSCDSFEPDLLLFRIETMEQTLARRRWQDEVFGSMFAVFAAIALILLSVRLYAATS
jgi:hypothetical protein